MIITSFATIGQPKPIYRDGDFVGMSDSSFGFTVLDKNRKPVGKFTLGVKQIPFVYVDVEPDEYEGRKFFRFIRGFNSKSEVDSYISSLADSAEVKKSMDGLKHLTV